MCANAIKLIVDMHRFRRVDERNQVSIQQFGNGNLTFISRPISLVKSPHLTGIVFSDFIC